MRIAIHAADLDHDRVDGTRVYLFNMLKNFGLLDQGDSFCVYHQNQFNPELRPPIFTNYLIKKLPFPLLWTQIRFAWELFFDKPDVLWMPVHNVPILRRKKIKVVVTIHDLAFKIFPQYFPKKDLIKLNRLIDLAVKNADHIIAVSRATKNDILKFYPKFKEENITVIHHGFDTELFYKKISKEKSEQILSKFKIQNSKFILYVGAIQPRKNLLVLIEAFEKQKAKSASPQTNLKLVLAGGLAWSYDAILDRIAESPCREDIIITGTLPFSSLPALYQNASVFIFPSLYEGFGIPVLEAFASGVPVICANNSSMPEVSGNAAVFFDTENSGSLSDAIEKVLINGEFRKELVEKGLERAAEFSWEKCAQQTLDVIRKKKFAYTKERKTRE